MAKDCTMLENSSISSFEIGEEEEIELSLGLSIGGSCRKKEKSSPTEHKTSNCCAKFEFESTNIDTDLGKECVDPQMKREIQAQRRQEARKKREEKIMIRKGVSRERNGDFVVDDKMLLEAQRLQNRVREREMREREIYRDDCVEGEDLKDLNLTLNNNLAVDRNQSSSPSVPVRDSCTPAGYSCPAFQYLPFTNGFGHPNVIPGRAMNLGNVIRPVVCRSFQPYHNSEYNGNTNGGNGNGNGNEASNGSPGRSSSDNRSKSQQDGSSNDSGSHSCHSQQEHNHQNSKSREQSEHSSYSSQTDHTQAIERTTNIPEKVVSPNTTPPSGMNLENPSSGPLKRDNNGEMSKPPKPQTGNQDSASMSQMPCVSTTGNGPNGKTITGFLYRYTKTEVSIICVCHGSPFSPAEFVKHAGGTDISHPLRHITVIPSAFG